MTNVERVERDIAREKMFREAFMNGKEPTDEDRAAWALADAHNQMSLDYSEGQTGRKNIFLFLCGDI